MAELPECDQTDFDDHSKADDREILAAIGNQVLNHSEANRAADLLLEEFGTVRSIFAADACELTARCNPPSALVDELVRLKKLQQAILRSGFDKRPVLEDLKSVHAYFQCKLVSQKTEQFHALFLDGTFRLAAEECLQTGTIDQVIVYPRELVTLAINHNATHIILIHNHPAGSASPSCADVIGTRRLAEACAGIGIFIADHIIIGQDSVFSFREQNLMSSPYSGI